VGIWRVEGVGQMPDRVPGRTAGKNLCVGVVGLKSFRFVFVCLTSILLMWGIG
jgi:hypothetical protein